MTEDEMCIPGDRVVIMEGDFQAQEVEVFGIQTVVTKNSYDVTYLVLLPNGDPLFVPESICEKL